MPKLNSSPLSGSMRGWAEKALSVPPKSATPRVSSVAGSNLAEAAMHDAPGARLVAIVLGRDIAVAVADPVAVEADRLDHAVAVEPVRKPPAGKLVAARAVAEQRAAQGRRHLAVDLLE